MPAISVGYARDPPLVAHCKTFHRFKHDEFCDNNSEQTLIYYDAITANLDSTGRWRSKQALRFPADTRNAKAAAELARLAATPFEKVDLCAWEKLTPYIGTDALAAAVNESSRAVSFRARPATINDFLECVLAELGGAQ